MVAKLGVVADGKARFKFVRETSHQREQIDAIDSDRYRFSTDIKFREFSFEINSLAI